MAYASDSFLILFSNLFHHTFPPVHLCVPSSSAKKKEMRKK